MFHLQLPSNNSRYKYRRNVPLQHSLCCPLNRTIIMKPVVLAVLLLLAVASIVSGVPTESGIVSGDTPVDSVVSGDPKKSGKSSKIDKTYFPIFLWTLQLYKFAPLLNYERRHEVWRNAGTSPDVLVPALQAKMQVS